MAKQPAGRPHNNRSSSRHQFKVVKQIIHGPRPQDSEIVEKCERCGAHYNTRVGGTAAVYCVPSAAWMAEHPGDDGRAGDGDTRFAAMMGMGRV
jgi:hypothetical protein